MKVNTPLDSTEGEWLPTEKKTSKIGTLSIFLAGGISNCPDWQSEMIQQFQQTKHEAVLTLYNPRRPHINLNDEKVSQQQIKWEYEHLKKSDVILFWFPKESICPISLFELGRWTGEKERIVLVGVHPEYSRKLDIMEQMKLDRPDMKIMDSLSDLFTQTNLHICKLLQRFH